MTTSGGVATQPAGGEQNLPAAGTRVQPPRRWHLRGGDVVAAIVFNAVLLVGMWVRHGQAASLGSSAAVLTAGGQLTALLGTYAALVQVLLMSRAPWLEQVAGMDGLARWHRRVGITTVLLICAHVVLTTAGYALTDRAAILSEFWTLMTAYPYVLMATVATALFIMVAVTSARAARARLQYETWHFLHFYAYLAIALSFGHELAVGSDFSGDPVAITYWVLLYATVLALVLAFRVGAPMRLSLRHDLRVAAVVPEGRDIASIYVTGRDLDQLRARAGQYFRWRFLAGDGWWKAHPFSLSAAPNSRYLRLTVKRVGGGTGDVLRLQPGTRVAVEGPYGVFTQTRRVRPRTLLIAGGIGITPIRALLEEIAPAKGSVTVLYRARSWDDVVFRTELEELVRSRRGTLYYIVGRRGTADVPSDPFTPRSLRQMVTDLQQRDIFVCGPPGMMLALHDTLRGMGIPDEQIHYERFALL